MSKPIDTMNHEMVAMHGDEVVMTLRGIRLSRERALSLAAWIVALADDEGRFNEVLEAVTNT